MIYNMQWIKKWFCEFDKEKFILYIDDHENEKLNVVIDVCVGGVGVTQTFLIIKKKNSFAIEILEKKG